MWIHFRPGNLDWIQFSADHYGWPQRSSGGFDGWWLHQFTTILKGFSLVPHVDAPNHAVGKILDVIITRSDCDINNLIVDPSTIPDHCLIACNVPYACLSNPVFTSRRVRRWKRRDREKFCAVLFDGPLCTIWASKLFDLHGKCRSIQRAVRLLERLYRGISPYSWFCWQARLIGSTPFRGKHPAFNSKDNSYWESKMTSISSDPRMLWRSVATIHSETAKQSANLSTFSASDFLVFIEQKVESIRSDTAGSAPPSFSSTNYTYSPHPHCVQGIGAEDDWRSGFKEPWTGTRTDFHHQKIPSFHRVISPQGFVEYIFNNWQGWDFAFSNIILWQHTTLQHIQVTLYDFPFHVD